MGIKIKKYKNRHGRTDRETREEGNRRMKRENQKKTDKKFNSCSNFTANASQNPVSVQLSPVNCDSCILT